MYMSGFNLLFLEIGTVPSSGVWHSLRRLLSFASPVLRRFNNFPQLDWHFLCVTQLSPPLPAGNLWHGVSCSRPMQRVPVLCAVKF